MTDPNQPSGSPIPKAVEQVRELFSLVGERWTLPVLVTLRGQKLRFGAIQRQLLGVSHNS